MIIAAILAAACGRFGANYDSSESAGEHGERSEGSSEHSRNESGEGGGEGEEDSTQYGLGDTFDQVRAGSRLIVSYNAADNAFTGAVENTTESMLKRIRVEIHLSNGVELGPTPAFDLEPGEVVDVRLDATTQPFDTWSAHAEVGGGEHGSEGEGSGEHGGSSEGSGEHGGKGEREGSREHGRGS